MQTYLNLLRHVLEHGTRRQDRTKTGTIGVFGAQARYDLQAGFPLLTTKKVHLKSIIYELLWFLRGETNVGYLHNNGVTIWDEWADANGDLGRVYGAQWRSWQGPSGQTIDQIAAVIRSLKEDPYSRRHIVSAWNPGELDQMALPPCHLLFQFYVTNERYLSCQLYQRSADLFLGVPFNISSYALLTHMVAQVCGYEVKEFVHTFGDLHIYENHLEAVQMQLQREPRVLPTLQLNPERRTLESFEYNDFTLLNYDPHPRIAAPISV